MNGGRRVFVSALLLSLAVHVLLAGNAARWWTMPVPEIPFPIEAHLAPIAPKAPPPPRRAQPAVKARPVLAETQPEPPAAEPPSSEPAAQEPVPSPMPAAPDPSIPMPPAPTRDSLLPPASETRGEPQSAQPAKRLPPAQRELPARLTLRYAIQAGEGGFNVGQATYTWTVRDGRYSLVSVAEAKGIAALFISGKIIQTSEGEITPYGLQPAQFWMVKGDRRLPPLQFDWTRRQLLLPGGGQELPDETQDLLSFPFHLAMTLRDDGGERRLPVTNGKKLREYGFRLVDRDPVMLGDTRLEAIHLQGERPGEGSLDVWLAPARLWLPVRIRTLDQKGKTIVLTLEHAE